VEGMLRRLGCGVLAAATPIQAMDLVKTNPEDIDLLISDVVMPGMNGLELAKKLSEVCLGMKTLFMSGYAADVIADHGVLEKGQHFLPKPFTLRDLEAKVRMILGR
jgi:two-component system cell cycle sensor histidine kinase/response regulator CckA